MVTTFFFDFPGDSLQISRTFSSTMFRCLSKAFTLPSSFLLFRQLIKICVWFMTDCCRIDSGPTFNSAGFFLSVAASIFLINTNWRLKYDRCSLTGVKDDAEKRRKSLCGVLEAKYVVKSFYKWVCVLYFAADNAQI